MFSVQAALERPNLHLCISRKCPRFPKLLQFLCVHVSKNKRAKFLEFLQFYALDLLQKEKAVLLKHPVLSRMDRCGTRGNVRCPPLRVLGFHREIEFSWYTTGFHKLNVSFRHDCRSSCRDSGPDRKSSQTRRCLHILSASLPNCLSVCLGLCCLLM